jgi:hypothetical protein
VYSLAAGLISSAATGRDVTVNWLEATPPSSAVGVSFGVPWPKGEVQRDQVFSLSRADGKALPVQSWTLAYWPDGSIKWTGFATVAPAAGPFQLSTAGQAAGRPAGPTLSVHRNETGVIIDTGRLQCAIPNEGDAIIDWMAVDGRRVAQKGRLVCILQDGPDGGDVDTPHRERYTGRIDQVTVEQSGPVRAVVKIEGRHQGERSDRRWLPFVVRLYFYAGKESVRVVHSIIFDGDQDHDFIRGLGIVFGVPMREEVQNRHVAFSGEGAGLWTEAVEPLVGRQGHGVIDPDPTRKPPAAAAGAAAGFGRPPRGVDVFPDQVAGKRVPNLNQVDAQSQGLMQDWAVWDDFKLVQPNADGFTIVKRTNPQSTWLQAGAGHRASGLVFAGDVSGGLGVSIRNFWQSYPASLEVRHAASGEAELCAWLWSPDGPTMDLRHYDIKAHGLDAVYEDVQPGFSTATGVARTSELTLWATGSVPARGEFADLAQRGQVPPLLVCSPEYLHAAGVFGPWSPADRSTPLKRLVEDQLDGSIALYEKEVEQRHWYGFWYFGNVMHSYDEVRHVWRYDLGGMAWDNTELASDMWLWYSFLRTGRADIFRLAEAETRNTSEVDVYHLGRFAGLGSRHNVVPWGCGAKEARISQAAWKRFYYYLSTDERVGDLMDEVANADFKAVEYDPMRLAQPETAREKQFPGRIRGGPDWLAFIGNWMTKWERTGDTKWRDKIYAGMDSLAAMPYGFRSGRNLVYGYDPKTGKLYQVSDELGDYNLTTIQGGAEVVFELNGLIDHPGWKKTWLQYCRLEDAPADVITRDRATGNEGADGKWTGEEQGGGRLAAYAYLETKNPAFAQRAIDSLFGGFGGIRAGMYATRHVEGPDVLNPIDEAPRVGTNGTAQTSLTAMETLAMCADQLPDDPPARRNAPSDRPRVRRPGGTAGDQRTPSQ